MSEVVVATERGLFQVGGSDPIGFEERSVDAISEDATWAIVDARELWSRSDGWSRVATADEWDLTCILPRDDEVLVGTAEAHLARCRDGGLETVGSFEEVPGRATWFTPWGGPPDVRSLAHVAGDVFVNVHVGGIVRGDGESRWTPTLEITADVHEVIAVGETLMAACAVGFAESGDGGESWAFDDHGLHATYARAIAATSTSVYMSVARGPRGGDAGIYTKERSERGTFTRCDLPSFSDNIDTGCLAAAEDLVAFGTRDGDVYASSDGGRTWDAIARDLPPIRGLTLLR